jgi:ethanolaminephosphotransferase
LSRFFKSRDLFALGGFGVLAALTISRRWNQTGQKHAGEPDIAHNFLVENSLLLWDFVGATYLWNLQSLSTRGFPRLPRLLVRLSVAALLIAAVTFKLAFTNEDSPELISGLAQTLVGLTAGIPLVQRARWVFMGLTAATAYTVNFEIVSPTRRPDRIKGNFTRKNMCDVFLTQAETMRTFHDLLTLLLITQSRATNIPLFIIFEAQFYLLEHLNLDQIAVTTTSLLLQYASFFAFGGSNAISSVDLSSAYNGVSDYNVLAVGALIFVSNWSGPIFWVSATNTLLLQLYRQGQKNVLRNHLSMITVFVTASLFFVMAACTFLRTHLFIWTVFSPKYLYSMAWSLGQHLLINVGFGSLLFWIGSK